MGKFIIVATRTTEYEIDITAFDEQEALEKLNDWISDDFEPYIIQNTWDFDVIDNDGFETEQLLK
jgi:hypothetical protein